jgi:hypothetical protein
MRMVMTTATLNHQAVFFWLIYSLAAGLRPLDTCLLTRTRLTCREQYSCQAARPASNLGHCSGFARVWDNSSRQACVSILASLLVLFQFFLSKWSCTCVLLFKKFATRFPILVGGPNRIPFLPKYCVRRNSSRTFGTLYMRNEHLVKLHTIKEWELLSLTTMTVKVK